jgi:hypothetical protein
MTRLSRLSLLASIIGSVILPGLACQKPRTCPAGFKEEPSGEQALWCTRGPNGTAFYYELYPGTRQRKQSCPFAGGVLAGEFEGWHRDGRRWLSGHYEGGRLEGKWEQWSETGSKVADAVYREGRLVQGAPVAMASICERLRPP